MNGRASTLAASPRSGKETKCRQIKIGEAVSSTGFVQGQSGGVHGDRNEDTRQH
jgi:hypothetical protein